MNCIDELGDRVRVKIIGDLYLRDGYTVRLLMMMATRGTEYGTLKEVAEKIAKDLNSDSREVYEKIYQRMKNLAKVGMFEVFQEDVENSNVKRWRIGLAADVYISKRDKLALIVSKSGVKVVDCRLCSKKCPVWEVFSKAVK